MNKEEIKANLEALIQEIEILTKIVPEDAFAFNALRVKYELAQSKLMAYQTQLSALGIIESMNTPI